MHEAVGSEASSLPLRPFKAHIFIWRENKRECKKENWSKFTASAKAQRRRDRVFWVVVVVVGGVDGGGGTGAVKLPGDSGRAGQIPTWRALLLALYKRCQAGSANPPRDATSYSCMFYILLCGCVDCRCRTSGGEKVTLAVGVDASCLLCNAATL